MMVSSILMPLEKIMAEGATNLWQCKVTNERRFSTAPDRQKSLPTKSTLVETGHRRQQITKAQRLRNIIPITPSEGSRLQNTIVFPTLSRATLRDLVVACRADRTNRPVRRIDEFAIYGFSVETGTGDTVIFTLSKDSSMFCRRRHQSVCAS